MAANVTNNTDTIAISIINCSITFSLNGIWWPDAISAGGVIHVCTLSRITPSWFHTRCAVRKEYQQCCTGKTSTPISYTAPNFGTLEWSQTTVPSLRRAWTSFAGEGIFSMWAPITSFPITSIFMSTFNQL